MRTRKGFTLIEMAVAVAVAALIGTVAYAGFIGAKQQAADKSAIGVADGIADNFTHYAALNNGTYPASLQAQNFSAITSALGTLSEYVGVPAIVKSSGSDTTGTYMNAYTDSGGTTFQVLVKGANGTGTVYCRDANGLTSVASSTLGTNGPWTGCP